MLTYADGVHVSLVMRDKPSLVRSLTAFGRVQVPAAQRQLLIDLMLGLDDDAVDDARLKQLVTHKMLAHKPTTDDAVLQKRLDDIGGQWQWQRATGKEGKLFDKLYAASLKAHARRKVFVRAYGQTPCMPETVVRRALLTGPGQQKVLCIGDDDLLSIPLAMLGHSVTVYDVDNDILLPFLRHIAAEWDLDISAVHRDLMAPQKAQQRGTFDVLYADPMSTRECFDLFLSRGLSWLKVGGRANVCCHAMALDTFRAVQRDMQFEVAARYHDFNHYYEEGFRENYYRSDMMLLDKVAATRPTYPLTAPAYLDILSGELTNRQHHCCDILAVEPKHFDQSHLEAAIASIKASGLVQVVGEQWHHGEKSLTYIAALPNGYLGLAAFFDEQLVAYDIYPWSAGRDEAVREAMREHIPHSFSVMIHKVARPHRTVVVAEE